MGLLRTTVKCSSERLADKTLFGELPAGTRRTINEGLLRMGALLDRLDSATSRACAVMKANGSGHSDAEVLKPEIEAILGEAGFFVGPLRDGLLAKGFSPFNTAPDARLDVCWKIISKTANLKVFHSTLWPKTD